MDKSFYYRPGLFKANDPQILVVTCSSSSPNATLLDVFLTIAEGGPIGISATFNKGIMKVLALASRTQVLRIRMDKQYQCKTQKGKEKRTTVRDILRSKVLSNAAMDKLGFDLDRLTTALYYDYELLISSAVDVQSMHNETKSRRSDVVLLGALGGETTLNKDNALRILRNEDSTGNEEINVASRAWGAWAITTQAGYAKRRRAAKVINTDALPVEDLMVLAKCVRDTDRLFALKPTKVKNDVDKSTFTVDRNGNLILTLERYKTRIRQSAGQKIVVETTSKTKGAKPTSITGRAARVNGKSATVKLNGKAFKGSISSVHTIGKDSTNAEEERSRVILAALQRTNTVLSQPLARQIFLGDPARLDPTPSSNGGCSPSIFYKDRPLNTSQSLAVQRVLSHHQDDRICLIHGPPGTGKTTVIAACVKSLMMNPNYKEKRNIWLIAQSNVAVKNIAEKLAEVDFLDFKLLVSNEFHFDWHEHLYHKIEKNVIVSSVFSDDKVGMSRLLLDSRVILCTLSMLFHPGLMKSGVTRLVPVETVIVDEASQIEIGDYLPMLSKFGRGIRKLALIGDDKQLAPYGADDIDNLRSIFEVETLRKRAVFLAKQYRMPIPIGSFISRKVYDGRLLSQHNINDLSCCRFVDISHGAEVKSNGSYKNGGEAQAVARIVRKFVAEGKKFRVITPYDAQRAFLEATLKREGLPWEDKCFCVDSFQGNEDEHIIISVVRSEKIGFLGNLRRSNVMLTRCKKSMTICTNRAYLSGKAKDTLLGELATELGNDAWVSWRTVLNRKW